MTETTRDADPILTLIDAAIARVTSSEPADQRGKRMLELIRGLPDVRLDVPSGGRCHEYELRVGIPAYLKRESEVLEELRPLGLSSAPQMVRCVTLGADSPHAVLVLRYRDCPGEHLVPASLHKEPLAADACAAFRMEMSSLARAGKIHPYARGLMHWLISSDTRRVLLERWIAVREGTDSEQQELLEAVDETISDRRQAITRTSSVDARPSRGTIHEVFGARRVLLPVVHPVSESAARTSIQVAIDSGCKGVFLINQGMTAKQVFELARAVRSEHPTLWIGLNLLGARPDEVLRRAHEELDGRLDGIWTDNAGVDAAPEDLSAAQEFVALRQELGWNGLYFGGVAFKYQPDVAEDRLEIVAATATTYMDVVCTSGSGTGQAASIGKVEAMRRAIGSFSSLALASGIDVDNVGDYLPFVDAFLVGTSLEQEFGVLDPARVETLQARIKHSRWT